MRIAIFSDNFYPELGGIQDSLASLGRELSNRGHRVNFYVAQCSAKDFIIAKIPIKEIKLGENVKIIRFFSIPVPSPTKQSRLVIPTGWRWLALKKFKPEIIHCHTFFGLGLEALAAARFLKIPLVGTNHWVITEFNRYSPVARKMFSDLGLKYVIWFYNHCDFVTAPSRTVLIEMLEHGFFKPHQVMSNQIDLSIFKPSLEDKRLLKKRFSLSNNTVVYAGRLGREKNIDVIIRALTLVKDYFPNVNLAIAGHGSEEEALKSLAKELHLEKAVKFFGTLNKNELARLYGASDIFVIASTSESQSMVLLQAMACGLPVIGADWRALPEYINRHNGYVFRPGDAKDLTDKIIHLFRHEEERKILGQGGLEYVSRFSSPAIADKWEKLYEKMAQFKSF